MMSKFFRLLFIAVVLSPWAGICQKPYAVTVHLPSQLVMKDVNVWCDNGKDHYFTKPDSNYTAQLSGFFYGRWVDVHVSYPDASRRGYFFDNNFCAGELPAEITIIADSGEKDPLQHAVIKNASYLNDMGKSKLDSFEHAEFTAFDDFLRSDGEFSDSVGLALGKKLGLKQMEFIRQQPDQYFSIWLFRNWLCHSAVETDTLLRFFNTVFPDSLRECFDGKESLIYLEARINARKGMKAPDYTTKDISGKTVSAAVNRGRFVLLDFWASWCVPCVASLPRIKVLRERYGRDKLEIVSISRDSHRKDFDDAVKQHGMNWTLVYGDNEVAKAFNVGGIPAIFLIDPDGRIVYDYLHETDDKGKVMNDIGLMRLNALLAAALGAGK